jgi:transposase
MAFELGVLALEWSNRPTDGHVNQLKFVERQDYGSTS